MPSYAAFLGHQPTISLAEISALLPDATIDQVIEKNVAIFSTQQELGSSFINELGGTLFIAKAIETPGITIKDIPKVLFNELNVAKRGKLTFSLRTVGISPKQGRDLYRSCKDKLKKEGRASRYVGNERKNPPAIVLHDDDLLESKHGCELSIISWQSGEDNEISNLWVGRTIGAQDIEAYSKRDMEKPARDTKVGLLPPKLAQMLLNFGSWADVQKTLAAGKKLKKPGKKYKLEELSILDPFCGTGVIPIECLLRHWSVSCSDNSQKAVNDCKKNLDWVRKEYKIAKKDADSSIAKHDARKDFSALKAKPDVIVTETTLGPALSKRPTQKEAQKIRTENEALQAEFLQNVAENLPGVPVVCTWPVWYQAKGALRLEKIWSVIDELGFTPVFPDVPGVEEGQKSLVYRRPDQFVGREIVILLPKQ